MSDWLAAEIYVGGELREDEAEFLADLLDGEGFVCFGPDDGPDIDDSVDETYEESLHRASAEGKPWRGYSDEARGGEFDAVEEFCREHKLTYKRWTEAKWDLGGYWEFWTPTGGLDAVGCSPVGRHPVVLVSMLSALQDLVSDNAFRCGVRELVDAHTLPVIPPLTILKREAPE